MSPLTHHDEQRSQHKIGSCKGQQTLESLSMLVCMRTWKRYWVEGRSNITLQGDSMTALYMATKLKASGYGTNIVARELALDLGDAAYRPDSVQHIPGVSNEVPDYLSRLLEPGNTKQPPPSSWQGAVDVIPPVRDESWYMSLDHRCDKRTREL